MFFSLNVCYFNFPVNPFLKGCFTFGVCIQKTRQDMEQTKFSTKQKLLRLAKKFYSSLVFIHYNVKKPLGRLHSLINILFMKETHKNQFLMKFAIICRLTLI